MEYLNAKIDALETNIKIKNRDNYSDLSDFKKDNHQPRTNTVKDEKNDLVTDPHSILAMWRNHFSQVLNVHGVNPLPVLFKSLLHGQKDCVFFNGHLIYILKQEHFRAFRPAGSV
jgi:hypothetical protein